MLANSHSVAAAPRSRVTGSPVLWMTAAVVAYSTLPVFIWAGTRDMSPWLFVAVWYAARVPFWVALAQTGWPKTAERNNDLEAGGLAVLKDFKVIRLQYLAPTAVCTFQWALFAWAVTLVDPSVVTVVFEAWPVLFGLLTLTTYWNVRVFDGSKGPQESEEQPALSRVSTMLVLLTVGAAGVALVVLSDNEGGLSAWTLQAWFGLLLGIAAAVLAAAHVMFTQLMGADQRPDSLNRHRAFVSVSGNVVVQLLTSPVFIVVGIVASAESGWGFTASGLMFALCVGLVQSIAEWCFDHASHLARDEYGQEVAKVNSLYYATPIVSLLLLAGFADIDIARPDLLIAGTIVVVAVNMVLHLDPGVTARQ